MKRKAIFSSFAAAAILVVAGQASAATCEVTVDSNDAMKFDKSEIVVDKSCKEFSITLKHVGKLPKASMGHNLVVTKTSEMQAVANDGMKAGPAGDYLKKDDARVIAATKMIGGGESDTVKFDVSKLKADEKYSFFCSFPGHIGMMKGALKLQ